MILIKKTDNTWIIEDSGVRCFVLEGKDRTALIDTGMNIENIKEVLSSLTDKELILLNTHADRDHIGGNACFDTVHIGIHEMAFYGQSGLNNKVVALFDGDIIDLGNRKIEVIDIPGHTPGSIGFYDINNKVLISGDPIQRNGNVFMFGAQRNLCAYVYGLDRLNKRKDDFIEIWPSHGDLPLENDSIDACRKDVIDIIENRCRYDIQEKFNIKCRVYRGLMNNYLVDDK